MTMSATVNRPASSRVVSKVFILVALGLSLSLTYRVLAAEKSTAESKPSGNLIIPPPLYWWS